MKKMIFILSMLMITFAASAQKQKYNVIGAVPFDAKTQQFGKLESKDMTIVNDGDSVIYVGTSRYSVISVNSRIEEENAKYAEYTANDAFGNEYTIKIADDAAAENPIMRYFLLMFSNNNIYDWMYYYTTAPTKVE